MGGCLFGIRKTNKKTKNILRETLVKKQTSGDSSKACIISVTDVFPKIQGSKAALNFHLIMMVSDSISVTDVFPKIQGSKAALNFHLKNDGIRLYSCHRCFPKNSGQQSCPEFAPNNDSIRRSRRGYSIQCALN